MKMSYITIFKSNCINTTAPLYSKILYNILPQEKVGLPMKEQDAEVVNEQDRHRALFRRDRERFHHQLMPYQSVHLQ